MHLGSAKSWENEWELHGRHKTYHLEKWWTGCDILFKNIAVKAGARTQW
jgi:hypothetical protein